MGESTFVGTRAGNRTTSNILRRIQLRLDWPLVIAVSVLLIIGVIFVFSSSVERALETDKPVTYFGVRTIVWILLGGVAALGVSLFDYRRINKVMAVLGMLGVVALVIYTIFSSRSGVAGRSIFGDSGQPTEFVKLGLIIYLGIWLTSKQDVLSSWSLGLIPFATIVGGLTGLILIQGDFSAGLTVFLLGVIMFVVAGGKLRQTVVFVAAAIAFGFIVMSIFGNGREGRISDFINGLKNPYKSSPHVLKAAEAIGRGGLFGVGLGESIAKYTGLPVPWTDSIFAVIVEEAGSFFGLGVIGLYIFILWRGLSIARRAPDLVGKFIASGISIWIAMEAFLNIGALVNLAPFGGNALPFISYGGSSMLASLIGIGLLNNISGAKPETIREEGRNYGAVVDLRRRDRRRSVPRPRGA